MLWTKPVYLVPDVQTLDAAIHRINHNPAILTMEPRYNEGPRDWQNLFAITRFFSINCTINGARNIVCYTEVFVMQRFHCIRKTTALLSNGQKNIIPECTNGKFGEGCAAEVFKPCPYLRQKQFFSLSREKNIIFKALIQFIVNSSISVLIQNEVYSKTNVTE